ncbi:hypothetical protein Tco_1121982 [Tanacetum coccineum]|uniref:Transposase MuDR plant domain-containing protein n=1 Tax=Tanacetum coccineum TaxID=301880 RepID=A0ABQ5J1I2_9ASTR
MIPDTELHQFDVHNDGYFAHLPLTYVDGVILEIVVPRMPYEQLAKFLEEKCGCYFQGLCYQVPSQDLERGLVRVSDDRSTSYMFDVEETFGRLTLYLDHLDMNLSEYLSQAITYDMDTCIYKKIGPPKKRTSTTEGVEARNSTTEGVEARTSTKDKGKEKVSKDASDVVKTRRCTVEVDSETEYESDDDSDYQSDKSVDYLSPGEDELIKLRNRMKANRKAKAKAKDKPDPEMNKLNEENSMPADNRYPLYDETTHWRLRKSKVGEKYTTVAQFKECLTYYALENGFSLWHERSGEVNVVAKCGQRPPRVSDPKKVKQRKQTKYTCAGSDDLPKCPWRCYARWTTDEKTFQYISLVDEHTCVRNFNFGALFNYKWIAKIFGDKIRANPDIRLCDIADLVMKKYKCKDWQMDGRQGRIEAAKDVMPNAEHKQSSKASYPQLFNKIMDKIKSVNPNAHKYLMDKNPKTWSRAFFEVDRGCEAIENGFSECFNSVIVNVRHKPLLTMLEAIRVIVLERMNKTREISKKWNPGSMYSIVLPLKPRKMPGRPRKKRIRDIGEGASSTRVSKRCYLLFFLVLTWEADLDLKRSDEGLVGTRGSAIRSELEPLHSKSPSFIGDKRINLSWNVAVKAVAPANTVGYMYHFLDSSVGNGLQTLQMAQTTKQTNGVVEVAISLLKGHLKVNPIAEEVVPGEEDKVGAGVVVEEAIIVHKEVVQTAKKPRHNKSSFKEPVVEQTPKPKGVVGRPRKKQPVDDFKDVDVVQRGPVRDEGGSVTRGGVIGSRGRGGAVGSRGDASGSIGRGAGGSRC